MGGPVRAGAIQDTSPHVELVGDTGLEAVTSCVSTTLGGNTEQLKNPFLSGLLSSFSSVAERACKHFPQHATGCVETRYWKNDSGKYRIYARAVFCRVAKVRPFTRQRAAPQRQASPPACPLCASAVKEIKTKRRCPHHLAAIGLRSRTRHRVGADNTR